MEVDVDSVRKLAKQIVAEDFEPCGGKGAHLRPRFSDGPREIEVRDARDGGERTISVGNAPEEDTNTYVSASYWPSRDFVYLKLHSDSCRLPSAWEHDISAVLAHELTHASDPLPPRGTISPKHDFCGYVNQQHELAAFLATAREELVKSEYGEWAAKQMKDPKGFLVAGSPTYSQIAHCLSEKAKRRFQRMAAIVWAERKR